MAQGGPSPRGMVDMARSEDEKREIANPPPLDPIDFVGDYSAGLCLCLDKFDLDKLDLETDDIQEGDTIDLRAFAKVRNVSAPDTLGGFRVTLQITDMAVENEDTEEEMAVPGDRARRRYRG
jgi:hypothetical protein